jgi:hypothetical protein
MPNPVSLVFLEEREKALRPTAVPRVAVFRRMIRTDSAMVLLVRARLSEQRSQGKPVLQHLPALQRQVKQSAPHSSKVMAGLAGKWSPAG